MDKPVGCMHRIYSLDVYTVPWKHTHVHKHTHKDTMNKVSVVWSLDRLYIQKTLKSKPLSTTLASGIYRSWSTGTSITFFSLVLRLLWRLAQIGETFNIPHLCVCCNERCLWVVFLLICRSALKPKPICFQSDFLQFYVLHLKSGYIFISKHKWNWNSWACHSHCHNKLI